MATPHVSDDPATQRGYVAQLALSAAVAQAVSQLWAVTRPLSSQESLQTFSEAVRALVERCGAASRLFAADQYRSTRTSLGIESPIALNIEASPEVVAKVDANVVWLAEWQKQSQDFLAEVEAQILADTQAAMEKAVADEGRALVIEAVAGDEKALGFRRVARPDACAWCLTLAIRRTTRTGLAKDFKRYGSGGVMDGAQHFGVYKSRATAGQLPAGASGINRYHPKCHCTVEPVFAVGEQTVPDWLLEMAALYDNAPSNGSGALNDFRRALRAQRRGEDVSPDPTPLLPATAAQEAQVAAIADLLSRLSA